MRRDAKTDANHSEIRQKFRDMGAYWFDMFQLKNACDGLVIIGGWTVAIEVKDGEKPPSARKLTEGEEKFMQEWTSAGGHYRLVESTDDVLKVVAEFRL